MPAWSRMRTRLWPDTPDQHYAEIEAYFAGTSNDIVQVYVIENEGGKLIGFIELNIRNIAEGSVSSNVPYVEGWYVDPGYQNKGYGRKLIEQAEQWARTQGFRELASDSEIDNHRSIAIHGKLGFKETERIVCFLKKLK
jgi:aminoglycoside 6'-N-acetyltransferase I